MYEEVLYAKDREIAGLNIVRSSVLKLLLPTKGGYALVSTDHLTQAIFPCFLKNWHHLLAYNTEQWKSFDYGRIQYKHEKQKLGVW